MKNKCSNCGSEYLNYWGNKVECCACGKIVALDEDFQNESSSKNMVDTNKCSNNKDKSLSGNVNKN